MTLFVSRVISNIKGGIDCKLAPRTLICGASGTGKTALLNTLELALSATASDVLGRAWVKDQNQLMALLTGRDSGSKQSLVARAILSTGEECAYTTGKGKGRSGNHTYPASLVDPEKVLPVRNVRAHVVGTAETARKHFLGVALPTLTLDDVLQRIPADLHPNFRDVTLDLPMTATAADRLLHAMEKAKGRASGTRKAVKGGEEVASVASEGLMPPPSDEMLAALKQRRQAAQAAWDTLNQRKGQADHLQKLAREAQEIHAKWAQADANAQQLQNRLAQAEAELAKVQAPRTADAFFNAVVAMREHCACLEHQHQQPVMCPVCKLTPQFGAFQQAVAAAKAFIAAEAERGQGYEMLRIQVEEIRANLNEWQPHAAGFRAQLEAANAAIAAGNIQAPTPEEFAATKDALESAQSEVNKAETLKAQWTQAGKAQALVEGKTDEAKRWKQLHDVCSKVAADLLDTAVVAFQARVQASLPPTDDFFLQLRDGADPVFHFGLRRGATRHTALSGAEGARVQAALAAACVEAGRLAVLVPEERQHDSATLVSMLEAFGDVTSGVSAQVVVVSTVMPERLPPGWLVVDTNRGQHRQAT